MTTEPKGGPGTPKAHPRNYDVLVVGGGGAGAPLAARLSEDADRSVLLLEAGPTPASVAAVPQELLNAGTVHGATPGHPNNWSFMSHLMEDRPYTIARGRILGGSTSISGTYFIRARKHDFDQWSSDGNNEWSWEKVLPFYAKLETDLQFGQQPGHGQQGPIPISRPPQDHPATLAFARAAKDLGFPTEEDKNDQCAPGYGPMPTNSLNGQRISTGQAYINPNQKRPNLTVQGNTIVQKVLFEGRRAVGVQVVAGGRISTIRAKEVVLAAGAIKTPHILLLSGIGPKEELASHGVAVVQDLPGVGKKFSDHPNIAVGWTPKTPLIEYDTPQSMAGVLNFTATGSPFVGDLEIIPLLKPMEYMLTRAPGSLASGVHAQETPASTPPGRDLQGRPHKHHATGFRPGDLAFLVSLQAATSRGNITLQSSDPNIQPRIDFNYLSTESDVERLRHAVRVAARILKSPAFEELFLDFTELSEKTLESDKKLDTWIRSNLGTAFHLSGTAKFGRPENAQSVVDQYGRVYGIQGLRIADTSILPFVPTRGPAATAVLIGERMADFLRTKSSPDAIKL